MHDFKELEIWKLSTEYCIKIYKEVASFPQTEIYGITSQIKRATVSIPSNIAEGAGRKTKKDFARFINIAIGSAFEVETQLIISKDLGFLPQDKFETLIEELSIIEKKLVNFQKYLYR
ncbi:MAG: four helix bundle protein [Flavobacteriaceae bacterium]|nr:four helix bundle protein [Flavobacteriaceae bacterium]